MLDKVRGIVISDLYAENDHAEHLLFRLTPLHGKPHSYSNECWESGPLPRLKIYGYIEVGVGEILPLYDICDLFHK